MNKRKNKRTMPHIQESSTLQGKCDALRVSFFPATVVDPHPMPDGFLPTRTQDDIDTYYAVSAETVNEVIRSSRMNSAVGANLVSYGMIKALAKT